MSEPKRKFRRKPVTVEVRIRDESGAGELVFDTADVSLGGAFLKSDLLLELGETIEVEFSLVEGRSLRVQARVVRAVRTREQRNGPGMGIEFIQPPPELRDALQRLLA